MKKQNPFVPRSILCKTVLSNQRPSSSKQPSSSVPAVSGSSSVAPKTVVEDVTEKVKACSDEQRWPSAEEPVCIVCGKYGEYICDETDEDVCSLKCKKEHLESFYKASSSKVTPIQHEEQHVHHLDNQPDSSHEDFDRFFKSKLSKPVKKSSQLLQKNIDLLYNKFEIRIKGDHVSGLCVSFDDMSLHEKLLENLSVNKYVTPTAVQMQVVPLVRDGRDVLVSASTGSGKTASFIIPIIRTIHTVVGELPTSHQFCRHPIALVLVPTRELGIQIEEQAKQLSKGLFNFKVALLVGGNPIAQQLHRLKHNIQLVIATPGRLNDILDNHTSLLPTRQIKTLVIDECDVMLSMGFHSQIQLILSALSHKPQLLMFSATISPAVEQLADKMLNKPVLVSFGQPNLPNKHVNQLILWVEETSKRKKLFSVIEDGRHFSPPVVIFVESRLGADLLCEALTNKFRLHCESIHSGKEQNERTKILQEFLGGAYDILVATNVLARGLDLINVKQVIIFDMPKSLDEYIHQVGRAGRMHQRGSSIAFINNSSKALFHLLLKQCENTGVHLPDEIKYSPFVMLDRPSKRKNDSFLSSVADDRPSLKDILTKRRK